MRTAQEKVLARIEAIAEAAGYEAVQTGEYSNRGTIRIQRKDDFISIASIPYNFQVNRVTMQLLVGGRSIVADQQAGRTDGYIDWYIEIDGPEMKEFFVKLEGALKSQKLVVAGLLEPATRRMIDLSTSHITREDMDAFRFGRTAIDDPRTVSHEYGLTVFVTSDHGDVTRQIESMKQGGVSDAFIAIYQEASRMGGDVMLINFDADADTVDGLPTFDW